MVWSKAELDASVRQYEAELTAAGRAPGTIATYVRDARAFVDWLATGAGEIEQKPSSGPVRSGPVRRWHQRSSLALLPPQPVPQELVGLHASWEARGTPPQRPIAWPRDRWATVLPDDEPLIRQLPERLSREDVRTVGADAPSGTTQARRAFVAMMAWGYGTVGYGPIRTRRILEASPDCAQRLWRVARSLADEGAVSAYGHLGGDSRLKYLGPSFGTKYLAFCQPASSRPTALIHDNLVSSWLERNGRPDLVSIDWNTATYAAYLDQMQVWATDLAISPEEVEYLIFQSMADEVGGQWARK